MYNYKRILVGLDNTIMDRNLIEYVSFLSNKIKPTKIYFINVQKNLFVPDNILEEYPEYRKPLDEKIKKEIKAKVEAQFSQHDQYDIAYEVIEGSPTKELLHRVDVKDIDLLVMGHKTELPGTGILPTQIARNCHCSLLLITEFARVSWNKIMVPTDFSDYSKKAMIEAVEIASKKDDQVIIPFHLYDLPSFSAGISYGNEKLKPMVQSNAVEEYNIFMKDLKTDFIEVKPIFQLNFNYLGAAIIAQQAYNHDADLIVIGSQGKTGLKRILLGSFAEKLVRSNTKVPMLIVK